MASSLLIRGHNKLTLSLC